MLKLKKWGDLFRSAAHIFLKDFQGGGRGSQLIELAEKIAQEHNKHKIWLGVWEHNPSAQAFYKRHGFKVVGEHHFQTGDVTDTDLIMEKSYNDCFAADKMKS